MKTGDFLKFLLENRVQKTILPSINLWLSYIIICLVLWAIFSFFVAAIFFMLGTIFANAQKQETKDSFYTWWHALPLLKFHAIFILVQLSVLGFLANFVKVLSLTGSALNKGAPNASNTNA